MTAADSVFDRQSPKRRDVSVESNGGDESRFRDPVLATEVLEDDDDEDDDDEDA